MSKYMYLIRVILISLFIFSQAQADTIYNLIKIPNLEIYNIKSPNKLRYLYAKEIPLVKKLIVTILKKIF